ncbi:CMRF35-like molecule 8 isoform X4 [Tachysurus fulvidraco]|uniref:CMRF35-like molecule 8 isoform X3 n=1 Tax=Tachysurus fulvidraco TaxID=1234273 RepID=UPI001FEDEF95|nr:CMRF35-like molecule 8 isoform X3 [Tachysurus fulvidraco]XP_047659545.1 CMRF35-like molecule 8 isoform X4 [Tachysurus fulvidraco]
MKILLIFSFFLIPAGTDAVTIVTGYRGRSVQIKCPYESGYEDNKKYLCRGECSIPGFKDIPVESGSPAKDPRFSLYDDKTARVFTVTITDLRPEDGNTYWCAIERILLPDSYTEILLQVKTVDPTISSVSHTTHFTPTHGDTTHSVTGFQTLPVITAVSVVLVLLLIALLFTGLIQWKKKNQASSSSQSLKSSTNPRVLPAPAYDYEEVKDSRSLSNTIYCTAQLSTNLPDGSETIYCNTELPTTVYSTAQNPSDPPDQDFYSTAQLPSAVSATSPSVVKSGESPMYAAVSFETSSYGAAPTAVYKSKSNSCIYATVNS